MYHHLRYLTLQRRFLAVAGTITATMAAAQIGCPSAFCADAKMPVVSEKNIPWNPPPSKETVKQEPVGVELYEFDTTPLGSREPLLMVHGLNGERRPEVSFRWGKLASYLTSQQNFNARYKIFLARHNTYKSMAPVGAQLGQVIRKLSTACHGRKVTLVALSMGGNIIADAMTDKLVDVHVDKVLSMATPFHGSPLFTKRWMEYSMLKSHNNPFTQLDTYIPYHIYFSIHKNLLADLNWDNSDSLIPQIGRYRGWYNPLKTKVLEPDCCYNPDILSVNKKLAFDRNKFIVYGGYLAGRIALDERGNWLKNVLLAPHWFIHTVIPEHMGKEHAVLRVLHRQIAYAVPKNAKRGYKLAYGLNDGITPLTSSLFLPNATMAKGALINDSDVRNLGHLTHVRLARAFKGADHVSFIDNYRQPGTTEDVPDVLSSSTVKKPIFEWIRDDLMTDGRNSELAVDPKQLPVQGSVP